MGTTISISISVYTLEGQRRFKVDTDKMDTLHKFEQFIFESYPSLTVSSIHYYDQSHSTHELILLKTEEEYRQIVGGLQSKPLCFYISEVKNDIVFVPRIRAKNEFPKWEPLVPIVCSSNGFYPICETKRNTDVVIEDVLPPSYNMAQFQ